MAPKQLRLFKVNQPDGTVKYYQDKRRAKHERDLLVEQGHAEARVMKGPDHWKGETF